MAWCKVTHKITRLGCVRTVEQDLRHAGIIEGFKKVSAVANTAYLVAALRILQEPSARHPDLQPAQRGQA